MTIVSCVTHVGTKVAGTDDEDDCCDSHVCAIGKWLPCETIVVE